MEFLWNLCKTIFALMPFLMLCYVNYKINLNKANRARQFAMPIITLVYCIIAVLLLEGLEVLVTMGTSWLSRNFEFFEDINWASLMIFIMNTLFVVGFIIVKAICLPIINKIWKNDKVTEWTSGWFYEKEDDIDKWVVKKYFANVRGYYRGFYIALTVMYCTVLVASQLYPDSIFFKATFYPVFGVLVLGEIVSFLNGMTKEEFVGDILGEDEDSYKVANYGMLRELLREHFSDRILFENTLDTSDGTEGSFEELEDLVNNENMTLRTIGAYFQRLKDSGKEIDVNYIKSSINLLSGKSTLFANPFYHDLTDYIMLPIFKQLIDYKKCLVVLGRDSALGDVKAWVDEGLSDFANTDSLWQSKVLSEYPEPVDVGILKFSDIHNLNIYKNNKEFLSKVGIVIIVEPSRILSTGQIGLSLLVNNIETDKRNIVYCACDRNCDGLVDALSHILKTSITSVTATVIGGANSSHVFWNADGPYMHHKILPNISRYLGMGTEIGAVALKYQLEETNWIGSEKFPVADMRWIAGQYYKPICRYANLPENQAAFDNAFKIQTNLWCNPRVENSFLIVEDEFRNIFEMSRVFSSRAKSQGFVNVISENYFLRDYMLDNVDIFLSDPKAIPTIVPDFARTERNMVLKLIMMMTNEMISESRIAKELMLCGLSYDEPYETLKELIKKHCNVDDPTLSIRFREELLADSLSTTTVKYYEINETNALYEYSKLLKNAYYIAEDEEGGKNYLGSKLYGQVFQAVLPGQFVTIDGKYYEIQLITPYNGVVVRRAADHITHRRYYKQLRNINLSGWSDGAEMGSKKSVSGLEITRGFCNIEVTTEGYLEMASYGDFANAKKVSLNGIPDRHYRNKSVLKIKLCDTTPKIRYTMCLILNEIFRTTYPEASQYICALVVNDESECVENALYKLSGDIDNDCIYIVEDSDIDMGLIVSVERNLDRYFGIIDDVLRWHNKKMNELPVVEDEEAEIDDFVPDFPPPENTEKPNKAEASEGAEEDNSKQQEEKKGFLGGFFGRFRRKKAEKTDDAQNTPDETAITETSDDDATVDTQPDNDADSAQQADVPEVVDNEVTVSDETEEQIEEQTEESDDEQAEETQTDALDAADEQGDVTQGEPTPKKRGFFGRIGDFFKRLFGKKQKKTDDTQDAAQEDTPYDEPAEDIAEDIQEETDTGEDAMGQGRGFLAV